MTLQLRAVTVRRQGQAPLFAPVSLTVQPGHVAAIMGASGSGKSTLLAAIGGHLPREFTLSGDILLNGVSVCALPAEARRIGVMFQDALLFPHLSLGGNLAFGLDPAVTPRSARRQKVAAALAQAGLAGMEDRDPATLSGGERARAALMRSLLAQPQALLLDEPFSKLDAALRADFRAFAFGHIAAAGIPAVMVTHDASDCQGIAGPILHLDQSA